MYYSVKRGIEFLYTQYVNNNIYVYPEHRDYDPGHNGRGGYGDLFPTNTPYLVISQGSSGSDRVFLQAFIGAMAAFKPDVKKKLVQEKILMPTLQMIFRSSYKRVEKPEDYLTGKAHPVVFNGRYIDAVKIVNKAQDMNMDEIPPFVALKVISENTAVQGKD
jgi:hypothetical protein